MNSINYDEKLTLTLNNIDRGEDNDVEKTQIFKQLND